MFDEEEKKKCSSASSSSNLFAGRCMSVLLRRKPQRCKELESLQSDWEAAVVKWRAADQKQPNGRQSGPMYPPAPAVQTQRVPEAKPRRSATSVRVEKALEEAKDDVPPALRRAPEAARPRNAPAPAVPMPAGEVKCAASSPARPEPCGEFLPLLSVDHDDRTHKVPSLLYASYRECLRTCDKRDFSKGLSVLSHIIDSAGSTVQLGAVVFANRAACHLSLRNYHLCVRDASEALARCTFLADQAVAMKVRCAAYARRACSNICLCQLETARADAVEGDRLGDPLAATLLAAIASLERHEQLVAQGAPWTEVRAALEAACQTIRDPTLDARLVECVAKESEAAALDMCAQRVLEFPDNAAELWFWFGKLQFACAVDTQGLSDVQAVLHRAIGMGGLDGHAAAKKLLQVVRSTESRSAVAAAFSGTRRWEQALAEYKKLLECIPLPNGLKAHFLVRRAWAAALGTGSSAVSAADLREALDNIAAAESLLAMVHEGEGVAKSKRAAQLEEASRCRVELLIAARDFHGAAAAAKDALAKFPQSDEVKKLYHRATNRSTPQTTAAAEANSRFGASPRGGGAWSKPTGGGRPADCSGIGDDDLCPSSSDDEFSSLNTFAWRARKRPGADSSQSSRGRPSSAAPKGSHQQRPASARPAATRVPEHYILLGIAPSTPTAGVVKAYRELALRWHPDRWSSSSQEQRLRAEETFKKIQAAYSVLADSTSRMNYDKSLGL